ncbi:hypothetical protein B7494_g691 [Chlorociboria aeruginascens]|nr:hypothetical protein B7494_g691 [Chlorociboria aeruginascens]
MTVEKAASMAITTPPDSRLQSRASEEVKLETGEPVVELGRPFGTWRWVAVLAGLYLSALLYVAADVQSAVLESLGDIEKLAWVGIGFPLGSVATILLIGTAFGTFDIKYVFILGLLLFEIGSAVCASAPQMDAMIIGRVIAGIGGAGIYLGCLNYISVFTSMKERSLYVSLIGVSWGIGCILGPIVGGGFAVSSASWPWAFWINLPLAAIFSPVYIFLLPSYDPQPTLSFRTKMANIDWVGAALNAATFALFMIVLTFAGSTWKWDSPGIIALWVVFGVVLIAFGLQSAFSIFTTPEHRLFPVQFVFRRTMLLLYVTFSASTSSLFVTIYYIPLYFQFVQGDSPIQAAVRLLPFILLNVFFNLLSGALLPIVEGLYWIFYVPAGILTIIGGSLMYTVTPSTPIPAIYGYEILIAIGTGLVQQMGYSIAAAKVTPDQVPAVIGFMNVGQIGAIAIALSISGSIFQNIGFRKLAVALQGYGFSDQELRSALAGVQSQILEQGDEKVRRLAIDAIVETISANYALVIAAGVVTLVKPLVMISDKKPNLRDDWERRNPNANVKNALRVYRGRGWDGRRSKDDGAS